MDAPHRTDDAKLQRAGTRSGFVMALLLFGSAKGVPKEALEGAAGLAMADLIDPDARVPDSALGAIWRVIGNHFPNEAIALELASATPTHAFGALAQAVHFSPTRREALESIVRYHKVLSGGLQVRLEDEGAEIALVFAHSQDEVDYGLGAEAALGLAVRMSRDILGLVSELARVDFSHHHDGRPPATYTEWFKVPVHFRAGRNAIVFQPGALDGAPNPQNAEMHRYITAHLDLVHARLLERIADEPLDRVRKAIAALARKSQFGAEDIARALGMSVRSLQRYTKKHGASLRDLVDEAREASARRLLGDERLSVEEVAFLVGYSDDRAFRRAFQRWTGLSPAAFRQK